MDNAAISVKKGLNRRLAKRCSKFRLSQRRSVLIAAHLTTGCKPQQHRVDRDWLWQQSLFFEVAIAEAQLALIIAAFSSATSVTSSRLLTSAQDKSTMRQDIFRQLLL